MLDGIGRELDGWDGFDQNKLHACMMFPSSHIFVNYFTNEKTE